MPEIKLIVGLGNPGKEYANTRHNIGFRVVDHLAQRWGLHWKKWDTDALVAEDAAKGIILLKPQGYMNNSGFAVRELAGYYRIPLEETLVIVDDFALPLGALRLRKSGSAGGHNGLNSIIEHTGTREFRRLRLGVGPLPLRIDAAGYVLSPFPRSESGTVEQMIDHAAGVVEKILSDGWEHAVSRLPKAPAASDAKNDS